MLIHAQVIKEVLCKMSPNQETLTELVAGRPKFDTVIYHVLPQVDVWVELQLRVTYTLL